MLPSVPTGMSVVHKILFWKISCEMWAKVAHRKTSKFTVIFLKTCIKHRRKSKEGQTVVLQNDSFS